MGWIIFFMVISIPFYLFPALIAYLGIRHKYQTEWKVISPDLDDIVMVTTPLLNWATAMFIIMEVLFKSLDGFMDKMSKSKLNETVEKKELGRKLFKL